VADLDLRIHVELLVSTRGLRSRHLRDGCPGVVDTIARKPLARAVLR
jgi:hypothetical protein